MSTSVNRLDAIEDALTHKDFKALDQLMVLEVPPDLRNNIELTAKGAAEVVMLQTEVRARESGKSRMTLRRQPDATPQIEVEYWNREDRYYYSYLPVRDLAIDRKRAVEILTASIGGEPLPCVFCGGLGVISFEAHHPVDGDPRVTNGEIVGYRNCGHCS